MVLDPLVIVLPGLARRAGIRLAGAVMLLDMCGNWWGNWHWLRDDPSQLMRLVPLTVFGVFVVASVLPWHRVVAGMRDKPGTAVPSAPDDAERVRPRCPPT